MSEQDVSYVEAPAKSSSSSTFVLIAIAVLAIGVVIAIIVTIYYVGQLETIKTDIVSLQTFQTVAQPKLDAVIVDTTNDWVGLQSPEGDKILLKAPTVSTDGRFLEITNDHIVDSNDFFEKDAQLKFNGSGPAQFTAWVDTEYRSIDLTNTTIP
jgi:ABC-type lipoprotein release transport system permease subunit